MTTATHNDWSFSIERMRILDEPLRDLPRLLFGVGPMDLEDSCRMIQLGPFVVSVEAMDGSPASWRWVTTWLAERASLPLRIAAAFIAGVAAVALGLLADVWLRVRGW